MDFLRRFHPRRTLDIVAGSILNKTRKKTDVEFNKLAKTLSKSRSDLNDQLRSASPTIYLVDPEIVAYEFIQALLDRQELIHVTNFSKFERIGTEGIRFLKDILYNYLATSAQVPNITIAEVSENIGKIYSNALSSYDSLSGKSRRPYIEYQRIAARAGSEIRKYLNNSVKKGLARLSDATKAISNLNGRIAFISPTFNIAVSNINQTLFYPLNDQKFQKEFGFKILPGSDVLIGTLVHAGHVGIYSREKFLGINMPSGVIAGVVSNKLDEVERALGSIPLHIESGIQLTPEYSAKAGMFLDMQFNFAVSMEAKFNSNILGPLEQEAIRSIVGNITNEALAEAMKVQLTEASIRELAAVTMGSPTFSEYLIDSIKDAIVGKSTKSIKHTRKEKTNPSIIKTPSKTSSKKLDTSKKSVPKTKTPRLLTSEITTADLNTLMTLINANLHEQLRKNMRSPALNYRSGRFAKSAKVEKMSESRAGMITAFYSYMKNPYATFAPGGVQFTESRNPKTLISKSIREIAATMVGNRMRAVST